MCLGSTAEEAWAPFKSYEQVLIPFVDAGDQRVTLKSFELSVLDCAKGLERAIALGWYSFSQFDNEAYEKAY